MKKQRNKFLTFMFSLLPGAGHMYMGFMKMGVSLMSVFFLIIFFSSWLNIGPLLFILPVLWFYSFFDCINKRWISDEEFARLEDEYLFSIDKLFETKSEIFKKRRLFAGILLLFLGIYLVWRNALTIFSSYLPVQIYAVLNSVTRIAPQIILGIVILVIGIRLIIGKKKESELDA